MKLGFIPAVLASCLLVFPAAISAAEAPQAVKTVRLLTVGNSFSRNATRFLGDLAAADGNVLVHHQAYIGGSTMAQHWEKVEQHEKDSQDKRGLYATGRSLEQELQAEPWDVVTIQQASIRSHDPATYQPYAGRLYQYIHKYAPQAEILVHQTWAYRRDDPRFVVKSPAPGEPNTQEAMYRGLTCAYRTIAAELHVRLIPVGDAFHLADTDPRWGYRPDSRFVFANARPPALPDQTHSLHVGWQWRKQPDGTLALRMDGHHASSAGEYLAGCVFYEVLFGRSAVGNTFVPQGLDPAYARFLQQTAHGAVAEPPPLGCDLGSSVLAGLKRAATFFVDHVATEGGYLYCYSADLQRR
ncbi:MAG TPA: DUF4886 domain-containing protein, partial [Pirellulales bacterium]